MICHKHKCIFIHIAKCAGTSVENAFGYYINTPGALETHLGWDEEYNLYRQHATPQQLFDLGLVSLEQWNSYYKFIIYRNSWSKMLSDYLWSLRTHRIYDTFTNFLLKEGDFRKIMTDNSTPLFIGDHLYLQKDYFSINNTPINYDSMIDFDDLKSGLNKVITDLKLNPDFFNIKINSNHYKAEHYSYMYSLKTKKLVEKLFQPDIEFFNFKFENKTQIPLTFNSLFRKTL